MTDIYGGDGASRELPIRGGRPEKPTDHTDSDDEEDDGEEEDEEDSDEDADSDGSSDERRASEARAIPSSAERKASEASISISTTISSSAEYVSPPSGSSTALAQAAARSTASDRPPVARGLLLLAQMSSAGNLFTPSYTGKCVELAQQHRDFVIGFIAQEALNREQGDNFIVMTPGVNLPPADTKGKAVQSTSSKLQQQLGTSKKSSGAPTTSKGDSMGQQYNDPRSLILEKGIDVIIVGRGILNADDSEEEAERYRTEGWKAIMERCARKKT